MAAWAAREAAVAARGPTAALEVALDAEPEPAPLSVRVRVPVGPVAGAAWGAGDQICADCHSRRSAGSMVQCRMPCVRWYHRSCGGGSQASAVDWVCKACDVVLVTPPSPGGSPPHDYRRQRREGPWRSCLGRCMPLSFFLSFFLEAGFAKQRQQLIVKPGQTIVRLRYETVVVSTSQLSLLSP